MSTATTTATVFQPFAETVAEAEAEAEATASALAAASTRTAKLQSRMNSLASERQGIISRRQRGEHRPDDGSRLELIAADSDGLALLRDQAAAAEQVVKARHQEAAQAHANALQMLARHEDEIAEAALVQHAEHLGALLFETMSKLEAIGRPPSSPPTGMGAVERALYGTAQTSIFARDAMKAKAKRRPGQHGPDPLSAATRRRLLNRLLDMAEGGDPLAAESLIRLSTERGAVDPADREAEL